MVDKGTLRVSGTTRLDRHHRLAGRSLALSGHPQCCVRGARSRLRVRAASRRGRARARGGGGLARARLSRRQRDRTAQASRAPGSSTSSTTTPLWPERSTPSSARTDASSATTPTCRASGARSTALAPGSLRDVRVLLLGAGGAARAAAVWLARAGADVTVVNRTRPAADGGRRGGARRRACGRGARRALDALRGERIAAAASSSSTRPRSEWLAPVKCPTLLSIMYAKTTSCSTSSTRGSLRSWLRRRVGGVPAQPMGSPC